MMGISKLNLFLLVAFAASLVLNWTVRTDSTQPNVEIMPEMARSVPYDAYAPNPNFADGLTLRSPAPGTIARGQSTPRYEPTPEGAMRAGEELQNPFRVLPHRRDLGGMLAAAGLDPVQALTLVSLPGKEASAAQERERYLRRGAIVYANYCQVCHGASGDGKGIVTSRGVPPPPPFTEKTSRMALLLSGVGALGALASPAGNGPLLAASTAYPGNVGGVKDGELFHIITYGQGNMAPYAAQISPEDRWLVILHIRSLQEKAAGQKEGAKP